MFDGEAEQVSEILLTWLTLNCVVAELPVELDVPVETLRGGLLVELREEGFIPELLLEDWLDPAGKLVLAEVPDSVPFTRTWCPTSFSSFKVSPCS